MALPPSVSAACIIEGNTGCAPPVHAGLTKAPFRSVTSIPKHRVVAWGPKSSTITVLEGTCPASRDFWAANYVHSNRGLIARATRLRSYVVV